MQKNDIFFANQEMVGALEMILTQPTDAGTPQAKGGQKRHTTGAKSAAATTQGTNGESTRDFHCEHDRTHLSLSLSLALQHFLAPARMDSPWPKRGSVAGSVRVHLRGPGSAGAPRGLVAASLSSRTERCARRVSKAHSLELFSDGTLSAKASLA
jgi:hypothetical protein